MYTSCLCIKWQTHFCEHHLVMWQKDVIEIPIIPFRWMTHFPIFHIVSNCLLDFSQSVDSLVYVAVNSEALLLYYAYTLKWDWHTCKFKCYWDWKQSTKLWCSKIIAATILHIISRFFLWIELICSMIEKLFKCESLFYCTI